MGEAECMLFMDDYIWMVCKYDWVVGITECGCGLNDKNSGCVGKLKWTESIEEKKTKNGF